MNIEIMDYVNSFWTGGLICVIAQILIDKTKLTPARILVSYVVAGVILSAVGIYEPFVKFAKCGATVPITGFGYTMVKGIKEAILSTQNPLSIFSSFSFVSYVLCFLISFSLISSFFKIQK